MTEDKRDIRRQRVLKSGKIILADVTSVVDCVIRNLSVAGARLEVPFTLGLPDTFTLVDVHANRRYAATVAWRRGDSMGVEFSDPPADGET